jgi:hypothetical protein
MLIAAWVTCTRKAPAVKVPVSAMATKALSWRISTSDSYIKMGYRNNKIF